MKPFGRAEKTLWCRHACSQIAADGFAMKGLSEVLGAVALSPSMQLA